MLTNSKSKVGRGALLFAASPLGRAIRDPVACGGSRFRSEPRCALAARFAFELEVLYVGAPVASSCLRARETPSQLAAVEKPQRAADARLARLASVRVARSARVVDSHALRNLTRAVRSGASEIMQVERVTTASISMTRLNLNQPIYGTARSSLESLRNCCRSIETSPEVPSSETDQNSTYPIAPGDSPKKKLYKERSHGGRSGPLYTWYSSFSS